MSGRLLALALAVALALASPARAADPYLRVIAPEVAIRSGPGARFRELYRARRDEVFRVLERATLGWWLQVVLPDGTYGWIVGDATVPTDVEIRGSAPSRAWQRVRGALFAPSPIVRSNVGLSFSGGVLGGDGAFFFRPSVILDDHVALEAHFGEAVGRDGSLLVYGLDTEILVWPEGPLVPFFALGGGAATSLPKLNGVAQASATQAALDAGGGLLLLLRWRITLRFDVRNYTLFTPDRTTNRQEYSGGLAVFF